MHISVNRTKFQTFRSTCLGFMFAVFVFAISGSLVYWLRWDESVIQEMNTADFQRDFWTQFLEDGRRARVQLAVNDLPHFSREVGSCSRFFLPRSNDTKNWRFDEARKWQFNGDEFLQYQLGRQKRCSSIIEKFAFLEEPLSIEESEYPLAYGMIVYQNAAQVYYSLSAIYQPQNAYCIAVDGKSTRDFKQRMRDLGECLPHVTIIETEEIDWCGRAVVKALYQCFANLTLSQHPWRYYQYYTGFDVPLKTNLEMVRIFKQLNKTVVSEILMALPKNQKSKNHLPLWKAGMSALIPRPAARFAVGNQLVNATVAHLIEAPFFVHGICPDELLWATIFGNKKLVPAPGSFEASEFHKKLVLEEWGRSQKTKKPPVVDFTPTAAEPFRPERNVIGRFQIWDSGPETCYGKSTHSSCAYGLGDIPTLVQRSELVAHKFHADFEPAAYFCMWKFVRERALDPKQTEFQGLNYRRIAQVRALSGESLDSISIVYTDH